MSRVIASRRPSDHFEPDEAVDPKVQRQLRGNLEQIDYSAYAANRRVLSSTLSSLDVEQFQNLASAVALARVRWVVAGLSVTGGGQPPSRHQIRVLAHLRTAYEELAEVYDAMRRMVERGYLTYAGPAPTPE